MTDEDKKVELVLREIRERVRVENRGRRRPAADRSDDDRPALPDGDALHDAQMALKRMKMNLKTTERTWSSLPPIGSYRHGVRARVELWMKRQIRRATHWFTYEQVNFNSAVHQSLTDLHSALDAHERALATLLDGTPSGHGEAELEREGEGHHGEKSEK